MNDIVFDLVEQFQVQLNNHFKSYIEEKNITPSDIDCYVNGWVNTYKHQDVTLAVVRFNPFLAKLYKW